jgi:hypothetical protein
MPHGCSGSPLPSGALEKASQYAGELVSRAQQSPRDRNYGNAIHDGNSVMGLVALRGGNVAQAGKYLLEAGKDARKSATEFLRSKHDSRQAAFGTRRKNRCA